MEASRLLAGRYHILAPLGTGAEPAAWYARDELAGRQVAVRRAQVPATADAATLERLRAEVRAAAQLRHPNIAEVYDHVETGDVGGTPGHFVVTELVDGAPLGDRLASGRLPWRLAVEVAAEVAAALSAAHARGLVHGGLDPASILLTVAGAKVVGFGTAAPADPSADAARDIRALGAVLYEMLAGSPATPPEPGTGAGGEPVDSDTLPPIPGLPIEVASLCRRCLRPEPADRPTSTEVARQLSDIVGLQLSVVDSPSAAEPVASGEPPPVPVGTWETAGDGGFRALRRPRAPRAPSHAAPDNQGARPRPLRRLPVAGVWVLAGLLLVALVVGVAGVVLRSGSGSSDERAALPAASGPASATSPAGRSAGPGGSAGPDTSAPGVSATPSPSGPPTPARPGPAATGCAVRMSVDVAWALGATVRLAIANTGGTPINGWTMSFTVADGVRIGQGWNGVWVQRGGTVTVRDAGYNAHVPPGNILGNVGANVAAPGGLRDSLAAGFVLNGTPCQTV